MSMNLPEINPYFDQAVDTVVNVINLAKSRLGVRQNLTELAESRNEFMSKMHVPLVGLKKPLIKNCEKFIAETIEKKWNLTKTFMYVLRYMGSSTAETSHFMYFEAVFSQPTVAYPIPQAMVSVFFRVEDKHIEPPDAKKVPLMTFRMEGSHADHDIRYVLLTADWILAMMKMKTKLFQRIEAFNLF